MPKIFSRLEGTDGRIDIPDLGLHVAQFASWRCIRRGDVIDNPRDPEADYYDLTAICRFVYEPMFRDPEYEKIVTLRLGKGRSYIVQPIDGPGQRTVLNGRSLVMERVDLINADKERNGHS